VLKLWTSGVPAAGRVIDKIVDLRGGMIDDRNVPPSLQEPLKALESRGNPYGKMASKLLERRLSPA
jgi:hypothetical protein